MLAQRTYKSASAQAASRLLLAIFFLAFLSPLSGEAHTCTADGTSRDTVEVTPATVTTTADSITIVLPKAEKKKKPRLLQGAAVGGDIFGLALKAMGSDWRHMEAFFRLNLFDEYFPIFELGIGEGEHEGLEIENRFHVRAPYFRVGCDYNFANKKHSGNRVLGGIRYGFSRYNYDYDAPGMVQDPVWMDAQPCAAHALEGHLHWLELVAGVETKIWSLFRLGWDIRAKRRLIQKAPDEGEPWYFPGFGKNTDGLVWSGSFKIVFDI